MSSSPLSKTQVSKAGRALRDYVSGERSTIDVAELNEILNLVEVFRTSHREPLHSAYMGLVSGCRSLALDARITQRLKRWATIVDKLYRHPQMQLANMQDIGGCRAVVPSLADLRKLEAHLRRYHKGKLDTERCRDYIDRPRDSGYRAVHLIVFYKGRRVEWQLRTQAMHDWAWAVERLVPQIGDDIKNGEGPAAVHDWLRLVSQALGYEDRGIQVPPELLEYLRLARRAATEYLQPRES